MNKPLTIIGSGGHAGVLVDILKKQELCPEYLLSPDRGPLRYVFDSINQLYCDDDLLAFNSASILLVNGIGSLPGNHLRKSLGDYFSNKGFSYKTVVSDSAMVSPYASLGEGVQVMAGAIIQAGAIIGNHTIVNTGAIIDHDCQIGCYNHIAPGATLSGQVVTGDCVHIGTGANVIQSISIGENSVLGAGSIVTKSLGENAKAFGFR